MLFGNLDFFTKTLFIILLKYIGQDLQQDFGSGGASNIFDALDNDTKAIFQESLNDKSKRVKHTVNS